MTSDHATHGAALTAKAEHAPEKIREIGASYGLRLTGHTNTRISTVLFLVFCAALMALGSTFAMSFLYTIGILDELWAVGLGIAMWVLLFFFALSQFFLVSVPKLTGLITTNELSGGTLHVYGPGLHVRFPWERFTLDDYIEMRAQLVPAPGSPKSRFVTSDGIGLNYPWTVQYGVRLALLPLYIRTDSHAIEHGFDELVLHAGQQVVSTEKAENIISNNSAHALQNGIISNLSHELDAQGNTMEDRFGIWTELVTVGPPTFDQDYTEALTAKVLRSIITQDAKQMAQDLGIGEEKALQTIMMLNKENVSQQIFTLQADEELAKAAPYIVAAFQRMGMGRTNTSKGGGKPSTTPKP